MAKFFWKNRNCVMSAKFEMRDQRCGNGEGGDRERGDAGLKADDDGKAADEFEQADKHRDDGRRGRPMLPNQPAVPAMSVSLAKPARTNMAASRMRPARIATEALLRGLAGGNGGGGHLSSPLRKGICAADIRRPPVHKRRVFPNSSFTKEEHSNRQPGCVMSSGRTSRS